MASEFALSIYTTGKKLLEATVSEVVVPAFDGECGILAEHENFIGLLGTGLLKMVRDGDDYWFMVSSGVFEVSDGTVTVLAEVGEDAKSIRINDSKARLLEVESLLSKKTPLDADFESLKKELDREKARLEAHRRTELLN